jgi:hypothetical protein
MGFSKTIVVLAFGAVMALSASAAVAGGVTIPTKPLPPGCKAVAKDLPPNAKWFGAKCIPVGGANGCFCSAVVCGRKVKEVSCQSAPH